MSVARTAVPPEFRKKLGDDPDYGDVANARVPNPGFATSRQIEYITDLLKKRQLSDSAREQAFVELEEGISKPTASRWIDKLRTLPKIGSAHAMAVPTFGEFIARIPEGNYALAVDPLMNDGQDVKFYKVSHGEDGGRWEGFVFLDVYSSDEKFPVKNLEAKIAILRAIAANPETASALYGLKTRRCGICSRKLTRKESRERGIGPVCAAKVGWHGIDVNLGRGSW